MASETRVVRVLAGDGYWPWIRQLPNNEPVWGDCEFVFGVNATPKSGRADDWVVVYEDIPSTWTRPHDPNRTIFFCGEPPSIKKYGKRFLRQFGTIVTTDPNSGHPNAIVTQTALPWHVGVDMPSDRTRPALRFNDFLSSPPKTKLCSVITSNKAMTREHARRLEFVNKLKAALGDKVDFYGRGLNEINDKDEALRDYRFHIALENSAVDHYWTEKLADPILRGCYPIYWGAPNVADYFGDGALTVVDITSVDEAIALISRVLASQVDVTSREPMERSRQALMSQYNIFPTLDALIKQIRLPAASPVLAWQASAGGLGLAERVARRLRREIRRYV